jgi:parallel beta-helix repeat protein
MTIQNGNASRGGGVYSLGGTGNAFLTVENCRIRDNSSGSGGGIAAQWSSAVITSNLITGNSVGGSGGGVAVISGSLHLADTTVSNNTAHSHGGGIYLTDNPQTLIEGATIQGNQVDWFGGGISMYFAYRDTITVRNSTISGNSAGMGGGVAAEPNTMEGCTITDNDPDGISINMGLKIGRSIIADNVEVNCDQDHQLESLGHNLSSDGTCGRGPTDLRYTDPRLLPLADNGGPTWTRLPLEGSPVIDAAGLCGSETDQRGVPRPIDGNLDSVWLCDIGAVEYVPYCDEPERPCDDGTVVPGPGGGPFEWPPDTE